MAYRKNYRFVRGGLHGHNASRIWRRQWHRGRPTRKYASRYHGFGHGKGFMWNGKYID